MRTVQNTFPDPDSDTFLNDLQAMTERLRNPPWWDLMGRAANWSTRLDKSFVEDDMFAIRWLRVMAPIRLLGGLVIWAVMLVSIDYVSWWTLVFGGASGLLIGVWALAPMHRAQVYQNGYVSGTLDGYSDASEIFGAAAMRDAAEGE